MSSLSRRLAKLEGGLSRNDPLANMSEFRFALWIDRLSADPESVPDGARVVRDFHCHSQTGNWAGKGIVFRTGHSTERLTADPDDLGRLIDAAKPDGSAEPASMSMDTKTAA